MIAQIRTFKADPFAIAAIANMVMTGAAIAGSQYKSRTQPEPKAEVKTFRLRSFEAEKKKKREK